VSQHQLLVVVDEVVVAGKKRVTINSNGAGDSCARVRMLVILIFTDHE
jgi:hypothetical protein